MKNKLQIKKIVNVAIVTALYVALTFMMYPLSYGQVQFRLSECLMILVLYNPIYSISLILGCFLANIASPMAAIDMIFGTLATVVAIIPMLFIKNKKISSLFPSIANGIIIGLELYYAYGLPFFMSALYVFIGEFVVVTIIGLPLFKGIERNKMIVKHLELKIEGTKQTKLEKIFTPKLMIYFALFIISILFYFKLGIYDVYQDEMLTSVTLFDYTFNHNSLGYHYILLALLIIPSFTFVDKFINKNPALVLIIDIACAIIGLGLLVYASTLVASSPSLYFLMYYVLFVSMLLLSFYFYAKDVKYLKKMTTEQ